MRYREDDCSVQLEERKPSLQGFFRIGYNNYLSTIENSPFLKGRRCNFKWSSI